MGLLGRLTRLLILARSVGYETGSYLPGEDTALATTSRSGCRSAMAKPGSSAYRENLAMPRSCRFHLGIITAVAPERGYFSLKTNRRLSTNPTSNWFISPSSSCISRRDTSSVCRYLPFCEDRAFPSGVLGPVENRQG